MAMRSRYSRRIYSMKFGNNRSSDYIDDEDIKFLENLISLHKSYLENFKKKINLDPSLLPPDFVEIYKGISENYSITKISESNEELYHNLDLRYQGEEYHFRNIREQIINYLDNKKHQIFTNHRVDFLINIALNTEQENLRDICKEMVYKPNKVEVSDDIDFESMEFNDNEEDTRTVNDMILTNFSKMDTLLLPYISMIHPKPKMEYNEASRFILETIRHDPENIISKKSNEKQESFVEKPNKKRFPVLNNNNLHVDLPQIPIPSRDVEVMMIRSVHKSDLIEQLIENSDDSNSPNMPALMFHSTLMNPSESNSTLQQVNPPPLMSSSSQFQSFVSPIVSSSSPLFSTNHSVDSPSHRETPRDGNSPEIIEISDEENDEINLGDDDNDDAVKVHERSQLSYSDIDRMIDFLIHRCTVNHDLHPSLLRDHQMNVELNGFLLFVNFSIRFSLKYPLNHTDRRIFDCIFISSVTVGLASCVVNIDHRGITIDRMTSTGFYIVNSRLRSVQVAIIRVEKTNDLFSVVIDPDIARLVSLTLFYIKGYHDTGILVERTAGPE